MISTPHIRPIMRTKAEFCTSSSLWSPNDVFPKVCYLDHGVSSVQVPQIKDYFYRFCLDNNANQREGITRKKTKSKNFRNLDVKGKNIAVMNHKYKGTKR